MPIPNDYAQAFSEAFPDNAFIIAQDGLYLEVFGPDDNSVGQLAHSFKGKRIHAVWPEEKVPSIENVVRETLHAMQPQTLEYWLHIGGEDYCFEGRVTPLKDEQGAFTRVLWVAFEITERKRVDAALQQRDALLEGVANAKTTLLTVRNERDAVTRSMAVLGRTLQVDRVLLYRSIEPDGGSEAPYFQFQYEWYVKGLESGLSESTLKRIYWEEVMPEWFERLEQNGVVRVAMERTSEEVQELFAPLSLKAALLLPIWVDLEFWGFIGFGSCKPRIWEYSEIATLRLAVGSIGAFLHNKRGEEHLKDAKRAADAANAAKSEFLAMMSHEIRTPMNAILGFTDLLSKGKLDDDQTEYVDIIKRSGRTLLDIINDILDFSKIESRGVELHIEPFVLERTVLEALELMIVKANEKRLKLDFRIEGDEAKIYRSDPGRLRQILINLVGNAVKFTEEGSITVSVDVGEQREDGTYEARFSVKDTGMGIPEDKQDKLFQPFSQVGVGKAREKGGTGLGLVICKRLINKMGGDIHVESTLGNGADFIFTLILEPENPIQPEEELHRDNEDSIHEGFAKQYPYEILLAEDNDMARKQITGVLEDLGYEPRVVTNGRDALKALRKQTPGVLLLDIHMPEIDGFEVAKKMRDGSMGETAKRVPIVAISAYALPTSRENLMEQGIQDFITKPVTAVRLKETLAILHNETI